MSARHFKAGGTDWVGPDFTHTSPYFIRESRPADLPDLEPLSLKAWPLPAIFGPDEGPIYYRPAPTLWQRLRRFLSHAWLTQ